MVLKPKRQLIVQPLACRSATVGRWLWALEDTRRRTLEDLQGIPDDAVDILDWVSPLNGNSLGTLLYHVAVVEADWLYAEVLERDFPPKVQALLPLEMRGDQQQLTPLQGLRLAEHLDRLAKMRSILLGVYKNMTLADFRRPRHLPGYDVTPEWVLLHLMQHEGEHRGQMTELRLAAKAPARGSPPRRDGCASE